MSLRIFQIAIVLFWVASIGWLVKTVTTPDHIGMVEIDPRRPFKAFFRLGDSSNMTLLKGKQKISELRVVRFASSAGEGDKVNDQGFSISGSLNGSVEPSLVGTFCSLLMNFDESYSPSGGKLVFRIPSRNLNVKASVEGEKQVLKAEMIMAGQQVFSYDGDAQQGVNPAMESIVKTNPMASSLIASAGNPTQWNSTVKAFRGVHRMAGRRIPVFLVTMKVDSLDQEIKIYFSESGEPLLIETGLGYTAISEVLVPVEPHGMSKKS